MMLLLAAVPAIFVGNQACAPCHAQIARAYAATGMARSSGRVAGGVPPGRFKHQAAGVTYTVDAAGLVEVAQGAARMERRLDYFIGSGEAGRSYATWRDGFLFEAPLTWYAQPRRWDASPGYEDERGSRWSRPIEPSCLYCHASQTRWREGSQNGYLDPPFAQDGVGCERCHGAGSLHATGKGAMVNPAKLEPERRDAVCAQCHLTGEARVERAGRRMADYRPGERLAGYAAYFVAEDAGGLKVTSHVEKLAASRCQQASGDRLWCGTCHDPHRVSDAASYGTKCLGCHAAEECSRGAGCTACHMPKGRALDGGHGVFTDHSIPRRAAAPTASRVVGWKLRGFTGGDAGERELGLAYAEVAVRSGDQRQAKEAMRLLAAAPPGVQVEVRLADLLERAGDAQRAAELYRSALRRDSDAVVALVNLGRLYGEGGQLDAAIALWRRALRTNPCLLEAGRNLQVALGAKGDAAGDAAVRRSLAWCGWE